MLCVASEIACVALFILIHQDLQFRQAQIFVFNDKLDAAPVCLLLSITGIFFLGHFDLNRYDNTAYLLHYAVAGFLTLGSLGLVFLDEFSLLSVGLTGGFLVFASAFFIVGELVPAYSEDVAKVSFYSKLCVIIEIIGFLHLGLILGFTMNASGPNNGNIWASPFYNSQAVNGCQATL
ncbi:unknown protein [Seminavis robusta]|uniref:Uncharacterized protein n=1 Tax=Seminavis robusta TaxID=568900 RepID=A0A9N8HUZ5_9STRA|nr:unknown protein [Seminavis robusta]|eukprot:Sro1718_g293310.1 n/a (178) ;mRNA; f:6055-6588